MGIQKNLQMEYDERGFGAVEDKFVCEECVEDIDWKNWIRTNNVKIDDTECSYGDTNEDAAQVPLELFIEHVMDFINQNYSRVEEDEGIYPDEETGEYPVTTWDTWDLVHEIVADEAGIKHAQLINDIIETIHDTTWCEIHPFMDENE